MRVSQLFSQTLRQSPAEADVQSHQYLLRAGFIRQLAAGIFSYLPLAQRALTKIEAIVREEMDAIGGQEITMPVVHPADLWKETGRWYRIGPEMARFQDRAERDMVLGMTHEEVVGDLVRREIRSYRQLPQLIYQIQTKFRDEPRPRAGLIRVREFTMKDSYSLDLDYAGLDEQYRKHYQAYFNIYRRCGLPVIAVGSDVGMMGGSTAHEFMFLTPIGEDTLLICDESGYAANQEVATFLKPTVPDEPLLPVEKVSTPDASTIEALAAFLNIPASKTAKAMFLMAEVEAGIERFIVAILRGDMDLNEVKVLNALKAKGLRRATEDEIRMHGAVPGYGSAIGVRDALVVVDEAVASSPNLVAGANDAGFHLLNTNLKRDYQADLVTDITKARAGDRSPDGAGLLREVRGVEVGNIFKLGTRYSDSLGCTYLDQNGETKPVVMGSYGIGIGRLLACVAEANSDEQGLIWPVSIAPYQVYLVYINSSDESAKATAVQLYEDFKAAKVEVLFDDRDERPGVKFNDADLIGLPVRVTIGAKSLAKGGVEVKLRSGGENQLIALENVVGYVRQVLQSLQAAIDVNVKEEPFLG
ncbi:MAG TPA: proline--tRNA ligase [Aggregatilineales bacterium]|nr:proline--tRNA ligase [Aggregatilineales bacterium]